MIPVSRSTNETLYSWSLCFLMLAFHSSNSAVISWSPPIPSSTSLACSTVSILGSFRIRKVLLSCPGLSASAYPTYVLACQPKVFFPKDGQLTVSFARFDVRADSITVINLLMVPVLRAGSKCPQRKFSAAFYVSGPLCQRPFESFTLESVPQIVHLGQARLREPGGGDKI